LAQSGEPFAVPDDPSRSGSAPIVTPSVIRLAIELAIIALATWSLNNMGMSKAGLTLGVLVVIHYVGSCGRIVWLLSQ